MSTNYTPGPGSGNGASSNNSFASRREVRASNMTGALPPLGTTGVERGYGSTFDFDQMILSLRELFEKDRQIASQSDSTRCGICYLHFTVSELYYREEGFYVCPACERGLHKQKLPMVRQQQKL